MWNLGVGWLSRLVGKLTGQRNVGRLLRRLDGIRGGGGDGDRRRRPRNSARWRMGNLERQMGMRMRHVKLMWRADTPPDIVLFDTVGAIAIT